MAFRITLPLVHVAEYTLLCSSLTAVVAELDVVTVAVVAPLSVFTVAVIAAVFSFLTSTPFELRAVKLGFERWEAHQAESARVEMYNFENKSLQLSPSNFPKWSSLKNTVQKRTVRK